MNHVLRPKAADLRLGLGASLLSFALVAGAQPAATMTDDNGATVGDNQNSQTAGPNGPVLLQDGHLLQKLQRFDRERIPERVVHARGTGAHGEFVASEDLSALTSAALFRQGEVTPVFVRFSTVIGGSGSPETSRDPRGFSTKFYTREGNWDLVGNHLPVFFIRDAIKFPDVIHSLKPSPTTNLPDPERTFDFFARVPEATHMLTRLFSDYGTPASYRHMEGSSVHAYKLVNARGEEHYVRFDWQPLQGVKNLSAKQASAIQARDSNHATRDLVEAINRGDYPKWDLYIQVLAPQQLDDFAFNPLDSTKVWTGVARRKVGTLTLNRNPNNVFQETEQVAMAPSNLVPGIQPSEDRMLQGRLFSYADTQIYRLGANGLELPINRPREIRVVNGNQFGGGDNGHSLSDVNYQPGQREPWVEDPRSRVVPTPLSGTVQQRRIAKTLNFQQAGEFYRSLSRSERKNLIANLSAELGQVRSVEVRQTMLAYFYKADADYGQALARTLDEDAARIAALAARLRE
ncbi:TPA: catalase [Pseudomonas aeruginosa]